MEEQNEYYFLSLDDLDKHLALNSKKNRTLLVEQWKRVSGLEGYDFSILCSRLTAEEYRFLFRTNQVTVVPAIAKATQKRLLTEKEQILLSQINVAESQELQKYKGSFLSFFSLKHRLEMTCDFILRKRGIRK
ncbi:MAG: hypothetical protein AAF518_00325 [Spirochaetota bacterium]